jgi:hypothetical protein
MSLRKLLLISSLTVLVFGCSKDKITGSGNVVSQERNVTGFTGVVVNGSTKAFIEMDTAFSVSVKGYENLLPYLETKLVNGALQVGFTDDVNISNDNTEVHIHLPALDHIETNGSGDMAVTGDVTGSDHLTAIINGSANITVEKGNADEFEGEINGDGDILALGFQSKQATIHISGSGNTEISVSDKLNVTISGSGNVYYHGTPVITTSITGSGQVIPK